MSKRSARASKKLDPEEIARKAAAGEDVEEHFTGQRVARQRVNVDFPLSLLKQIDAECKRVGITRQAWIKMACDERVRSVEESLIRLKRAS